MQKTAMLLRKLAPDACPMMGVPAKPKGMHTTTYRCISTKAEYFLSLLIPEWAAVQERVRSHLVDLSCVGQEVAAASYDGWANEIVEVNWPVLDAANFGGLSEIC